MKNHLTNGPRWLQAMMLTAWGGFFAMNVFAGDTSKPLSPPRLMVDYVDPSLLQTNALRHTLPHAAARVLPSDEDATVPMPSHIPILTAGDRWQHFESEYGIQEKESTAVGRFVQSVKYDLDTVTFGVTEAAHFFEFSHRLDTSWSSGEPYEVPDELRYLLPLYDTLSTGQIKSVISLHDSDTGKPFFGLEYEALFGAKLALSN